MGAMFTRSEMDQFWKATQKNMLTGLFQNHIPRVSMPTLNTYSCPQSREAWHPLDWQCRTSYYTASPPLFHTFHHGFLVARGRTVNPHGCPLVPMAPCICANAKVAREIFASDMFAYCMLALVKSASVRSAPKKFVSTIVAPEKSPRKCAKKKSLLLKSAPEKTEWFILAWWNLESMATQLMNLEFSNELLQKLPLDKTALEKLLRFKQELSISARDKMQFEKSASERLQPVNLQPDKSWPEKSAWAKLCPDNTQPRIESLDACKSDSPVTRWMIFTMVLLSNPNRGLVVRLLGRGWKWQK